VSGGGDGGRTMGPGFSTRFNAREAQTSPILCKYCGQALRVDKSRNCKNCGAPAPAPPPPPEAPKNVMVRE
jgi:hypothetical protein